MTRPALIKRSLFSVSLATISAVMLYGAPNSEQLLLPSVYMQWDVWEFEVQQLAEGENCVFLYVLSILKNTLTFLILSFTCVKAN